MANKTIFSFSNYREYLKNYIEELPKSHGVLRAWADKLNVHSTLISQVMMGKRDFTEDQALDFCDIIKLGSLEKDYFIGLLRQERAGTPTSKKYHQEKLREIRSKANELVNRIDVERRLTDQESSIFYSSWIYSAIRLCCSLEDGKTIAQISDELQLADTQVETSVEFLTECGFLKQNGEQYKIGSQYTHLNKDSIYLSRHLSNWRIKALQHIDHLTAQDLMYSSPFTISEKDFAALREQLLAVIQEFLKTVKASESETMACFNIDLFKIGLK